MMKIVICDDNSKDQKKIERYISDFFHSQGTTKPKLSFFSTAEDMLRKPVQYDFAFLDVEMPGLSGISAVRELREWNPDIIIFIVTGHEDTYLDESFDAGVFRYLKKPVDEPRFYRSMQIALKKYTTSNQMILIETKEESFRLPVSSIIMIESDSRVLKIHTPGETYTVHSRMKELLPTLPESCFMEINRGLVVGLKYVLRESDRTLTLKHLEKRLDIVVSKKYLGEFHRRWLLYQMIE